MVNHHRYLYHVLDRSPGFIQSALDSLKNERIDLEDNGRNLLPQIHQQRVAGEPLPAFKKSNILLGSVVLGLYREDSKVLMLELGDNRNQFNLYRRA